MMDKLAALGSAANIPCELSLETPMACGIGACFSCVAKIRQKGGWDYRRVCVDGPVFDATQVVFDP
jgi:dihydroorotate dehydrogenase electron transfer subunit